MLAILLVEFEKKVFEAKIPLNVFHFYLARYFAMRQNRNIGKVKAVNRDPFFLKDFYKFYRIHLIQEIKSSHQI